MPLQIPNQKADTKAAATEKKEVVTEEAAAPVATEGKVYGARRKDLAFVCPLGDPSNPDTTKIDAPDGSKGKKVTSTIVGYKFEVLADSLMIPDCGTNEGLRKDPMNYDVVEKWAEHKKGDIVALTPYETALLLSQEDFNGGCDGGQKPVTCVYQIKSIRNKNGGVATTSAVAQIPRVSLRATTGSIKDFDIEDVLTFTKTEVNGVTRKNRVIKEGYEKWAPLCVAAQRKATSARGPVDSSKVANKNAMAFLAFVNAKKGN